MYCIYIYFIIFYIMYNIHIVKRFRAHCGFYAIENKLLLLLLYVHNSFQHEVYLTINNYEHWEGQVIHVKG